jgi:cell division protein FtsB
VQVDLGIWSKLTQVVILLVVVAVLLLIGRTYLPLIQENERMRADILQKDDQIQKQEAISRQLHAEIEALRHDPQTVERLVREKLRYAKTNETIIHFEAGAASPAAR